MARPRNYRDDRLLEAVMEYAELHPDGQISASAVAKWAREVFEDLRGVKYYHFTDPSTSDGKLIKRPCTKKLEEINEIRKMNNVGNIRCFTTDGEIEEFFNSSPVEQRRILLKTGKELKRIRADNAWLRGRNKLLERQLIATDAERIACMNPDEIQKLESKLEKLEKQFRYIIGKIDEREYRAMLAEAGITDSKVSYTQMMAYFNSLKGQVFDADAAIRRDQEGAEASSVGLLTDVDGEETSLTELLTEELL